MKKIQNINIFDTYEIISNICATYIASEINKNPCMTLGLATGETPVGAYKALSFLHNYLPKEKLSFEKITTINLDEYIGFAHNHPQSYGYFMNKHLLSRVNINHENCYLPNGIAEDPIAECKRYNKIIEENPIELQLLGIGSNGHIAFNEPSDTWSEDTHEVSLTEQTIKDNAHKFFNGDLSLVPKSAFSMGSLQILKAKKIILLASGASKAQAVFDALSGKITPKCPASILQEHPNVTWLIDKDAASILLKSS